jgi:hypothetical protein
MSKRSAIRHNNGDRLFAYLLAAGLLIAIVVAAVARAEREGTPVGNSAVTGYARVVPLARDPGPQLGPRVTPCRRPLRLRSVKCLSQRVLERTARHVARHGGVLGSCYGCATPYMRVLSVELVARAFPPASRLWAVCVVGRESGGNPGSISRTRDYGLPQIHVAAHPEFSAWLLTHDPVYSAKAFVRLSQHGRHRAPWEGGRYAC